MPITTKVVSSNPAHGEVYLIQHYLINLSVTFDRLMVFSCSFTNKTDHHDMTEILLKVALNTLTLTKINKIMTIVFKIFSKLSPC